MAKAKKSQLSKLKKRPVKRKVSIYSPDKEIEILKIEIQELRMRIKRLESSLPIGSLII